MRWHYFISIDVCNSVFKPYNLQRRLQNQLFVPEIDTVISKPGLENPRSRSWARSKFEVTILSNHIPLVSCQLALPFLRHSIFKILPWNCKVKIIAQGHKVGITPYWHPFRSMSIGPPIPGIQLFQNLTLKIQGQGHGWSQSWKSQHGSNIQSTDIPFVPCQPGMPFLSYDFF